MCGHSKAHRLLATPSIAGPMSEAFVLGGVRTPFARYGGSLSHLRTDDLLGADHGGCVRARRGAAGAD